MNSEINPQQTLDEDIRKRLTHDYERVKSRISRILSGKSVNATIYDGDYLDPTIGGPVVPLTDPYGELEYFRGIRNSLEIAIATGEISEDMMPPRADEYLWKLKKP